MDTHTTRLALVLLLPTMALSLHFFRSRAPPREISAYRKEAAVAIRLARRCGRAMRDADAASRKTVWKDGDGGIDPCTATDEANERLVVEGLGAAFPTHKVVGEEWCSTNGIPILDGDDVPTWIVDPIDGTQNFVHGLPCSCVSIGMAVRGVPKLGIVLDPYRNELWVAAAGEGAYLNGRRLRVSASASSADLSAYTVLTDLGYERGPAAKPLARLYEALLDNNVRAVRILGSSVISLCYVASSRASSIVIGLVERDCPKPWDWCAGTLVALEAGCTLEMIDGRRAPPGDSSKLPTSGEAFDLLSRSCVCAESPELCTRLRKLALDAIAG
jgi:fructose-1,6-bisphosphatase/inositol monophosphatase family enzyme